MSKGKERPIYLDYHSTTPVDKRVAEKVVYYMTEAFGNPGSVTHSYSEEADQAVKEAKTNISALVNCHPSEIIFTSGATESVNLAIMGIVLKDCSKKHKIAVLPVEHKAVLDTCKTLEKKGLMETLFIEVDSKGRIDLEHFESLCKDGLSLACTMMANNEIGNIYPIAKICEIASKYNVPVLSDATQATGKVNIDFANWGVSLLAISAHKMYGPKGSGALIVKRGNRLLPMLCGGGQQNGIRPGTLNVSGIVGLGEACKIAKQEMEADSLRISNYKNKMLVALQNAIPELLVNGDAESKLAGNLSVSIPSIKNQEIISAVRDKIAISTGSACSAGFEAPSHVLTALKLPNEVIMGTLRIGLGKYTTEEDINTATEVIINAVNNVKEKALSLVAS